MLLALDAPKGVNYDAKGHGARHIKPYRTLVVLQLSQALGLEGAHADTRDVQVR